MFHHARGRQLHRAAVRQAAHGNIGAAVVLQGASNRQHFVGGMTQMRRFHRPLVWSPWYASNWLVRRAIRREMVRRSVVISIAATVPIHETIVVVNPSNQLVILPADSQVQVCTQHVLVDLPEVIEVVFDQEGKRTTLYADRKCKVCGQHFFCYPSDSPPPYSPPGVPPPSSAPYPTSNPPYPASNPPYPTSNPPYPTSTPPYPQVGPSSMPPSYSAQPPAPQALTCLMCAKESPAGSKFCGFCGNRFPVYCSGCGAIGEQGSHFCGSCGKPFA